MSIYSVFEIQCILTINEKSFIKVFLLNIINTYFTGMMNYTNKCYDYMCHMYTFCTQHALVLVGNRILSAHEPFDVHN